MRGEALRWPPDRCAALIAVVHLCFQSSLHALKGKASDFGSSKKLKSSYAHVNREYMHIPL